MRTLDINGNFRRPSRPSSLNPPTTPLLPSVCRCSRPNFYPPYFFPRFFGSMIAARPSSASLRPSPRIGRGCRIGWSKVHPLSGMRNHPGGAGWHEGREKGRWDKSREAQSEDTLVKGAGLWGERGTGQGREEVNAERSRVGRLDAMRRVAREERIARIACGVSRAKLLCAGWP